jgi:hypothetical protein
MQVLSVLIGSLIAILQALILFILKGLKDEQKEMWNRLYRHYHKVHCDHAQCKDLETGDVIISG